MQDFVHLHLHSEYSLLDGASRIREIPKAAKAAGHSAVAITDHGVMYGAVSFFRACKKEGVKPIIGCEVYVAERSRFKKEGKVDSSGYHLILLCKNETGYQNLIRMVSSSFTEGFYSKPRIDMELLEENREGLIALSACLAGYIPQRILLGDYEGAKEYALRMNRLFPGDFYLEVQNHGIADELTVAGSLLRIHRETGIPLVATNDVHYLKKSDAEIQATLLCIQTNNVMADGRPIGFETDEFYYKSTEEMQALFSDYPDALSNTKRIADACDFEFTFGRIHLLTYPKEEGKDHRTMLYERALAGLERHVARGDITFEYGKREEYLSRIEYEMSVIDKMGYAGYYLIVCDFIAFAKGRSIPVGPGRGSGAGSMVAYCVGITDIDPFRFHLLFERFLNPERVSMPDFDTDFCYERRDEVISYVREKYGADHVSQIVTFGTMAARAAVRDVGRALGMPYGDVDQVAKLIPRELNITIEEAMKGRELQEKYRNSDEIRRLIDTAKALEGMPRHASTHAAGIVITEEPLDRYVPLSVNGDSVVTQYDMDTVAELGLVKFDFLGLRYLTIIADAEREIHESDPSFDITAIPLEDEAAYRLISEGKTSGVFQLESTGMRQMLMQMKPRSIYDITAAIALYRPGPMDSIPHYLACREGREEVVYETPELREILGDTYGCIVYQEQVMQIFRALAGYSYARADIVRRAMAKKKAEVLAAEREDFLKGCEARGIAGEVASGIFDKMQSFAEYAFNKSHAAAYAMLSYRTAYLKAHYPKEYMAALLTSVLGNLPKTGEYIAEAGRYGIRVLPPDINESRKTFSVAGKNIRFGLLAVKNVGVAYVETILSERKKGEYKSFQDFLERTFSPEAGKRQVEALVKCGAFDRLGVYRSRILASLDAIYTRMGESSRSAMSGQLDIFSLGEEISSATTPFEYPDIPEFGVKELLILEKESSGLYFSGHMIEDYSQNLADEKTVEIARILECFSDGEWIEGARYREGDTVTLGAIVAKKTEKSTKDGSRMCFLSVEDRYGEIECVVFPKVYAELASSLYREGAYLFTGRISVKEGEMPKLLLSSVKPLLSNRDYAGPSKGANVPPREKKLYLRIPSVASDLTGTVLKWVEKYPGSVPVILFDRESGKYLAVPGGKIREEAELIEGLRRLLGSENVVLK